MSAAGTVLSHPTMHTSASKSCAWAMSSMESAMTSRETSDARIPGVPWDWLSDTAIVVKGSATPPAAVDRRRGVLGERAVVEVARHRPRPGRRDADDRAVEPGRVDPHGAEVRRAGARSGSSRSLRRASRRSASSSMVQP